MAKQVNRSGDVVVQSAHIDAQSQTIRTHYGVIDLAGRMIAQGTFETPIAALTAPQRAALLTIRTALTALSDIEHDAREAAYVATNVPSP